MVDERWFSTRDIAQLLKVSDQTVWRWLKSGQLKGRNFSGKTGWRVRESDLRAFLDGNEGKVIAA